MSATCFEDDSLGPVIVAAGKRWGAQPQGSLERSTIGKDLVPWEVIASASRQGGGCVGGLRGRPPSTPCSTTELLVSATRLRRASTSISSRRRPK